MLDEILALLRNGGDTLFAAERAERDQIEVGCIAIGKRYFELINDLYWKAKDVNAAVNLGRLGVHYCLTHALERNAEEANELRDVAKQLAFNIGSFAWPGWAEPGITITAAVLDAGRDAARLNLRLAIELNRPAKGMSNAHWLIGAYAVVDRQTTQATDSFERAAALSEEAGDAAAAAMNRSYAALACLLVEPDDHFLQSRFDDTLKAVASLNSDDAVFYVRQLKTAHAALGEFLKTSR
jgi:hypothetical protein